MAQLWTAQGRLEQVLSEWAAPEEAHSKDRWEAPEEEVTNSWKSPLGQRWRKGFELGPKHGGSHLNDGKFVWRTATKGDFPAQYDVFLNE